jgi:hypothetical protein
LALDAFFLAAFFRPEGFFAEVDFAFFFGAAGAFFVGAFFLAGFFLTTAFVVAFAAVTAFVAALRVAWTAPVTFSVVMFSRAEAAARLIGRLPSAEALPIMAPTMPPAMAPTGPPIIPPIAAPPIPPAVCFETSGRFFFFTSFFAMTGMP